MRDLVVWTGPVALYQVPGATVSPYPDPPLETSVGCTGDGSTPPKCSDAAWALRSAGGGSILEGMAKKVGTTLSEVQDVFVGAFSAGGGVVSRMLNIPHDRDRVKAVMLSDATYTAAWKDKKNRIPIVSQTIVDFAIQVASADEQLFVATASPSPNFEWATGVENLREYRRQIEEQTGWQFEQLDHFYGIDPAPDAAYQLGNVIFAEYPMKPLGHGHTSIADQVWQKILQPWLDAQRQKEPPGPGPPGPQPPGPGEPGPDQPLASYLPGAIALVAGVVLSFSLIRYLRRT
jgi:hypothetical protein